MNGLPAEVQALLNALAGQRNQAFDDLAAVLAQLHMANARIKELEAAVAANKGEDREETTR